MEVEYIFHVESTGDIKKEISAFYDRVTLKFDHGEPRPEDMVDMIREFKQYLFSWLVEHKGRVLTDKEYKDRQKQIELALKRSQKIQRKKEMIKQKKK